MNINDAYPSNYLKAHDLQGRTVNVVMDRVGFEKIGSDEKPVLYFQGKEKGLVLNKTNANNIAHVYGPETDGWRGQSITLFEAMVDFRGETVAAIRVRGPRQQSRPNGSPPRQRPVGGVGDVAVQNADMNDEIPF